MLWIRKSSTKVLRLKTFQGQIHKIDVKPIKITKQTFSYDRRLVFYEKERKACARFRKAQLLQKRD